MRSKRPKTHLIAAQPEGGILLAVPERKFLQVGLSPEETVEFCISTQPSQKQIRMKKRRHKGEPGKSWFLFFLFSHYKHEYKLPVRRNGYGS